MSALIVCAHLFLCIQSALGAISPTTPATTSYENLTCPSRTINYLTHTLPQQCLPSSRAEAYTSSVIGNGTITSPAVSASATNADGPSQANEQSRTTQHTDLAETISSSTTKTSLSSSNPTSIHLVTTVVATPLTGAAPVALLPSVADEDSPLESGNFLSFEEWKKQNLIKLGQSEHLGKDLRAQQRPRNIQNTLDSLGDDGEIDIDFSGLVSGGSDGPADNANKGAGYVNHNRGLNDSGSKLRARPKGKDAGTTCKERFNYASLDCAASVLKTNPEAKSPNTVLLENKDLYMLNKCSAKNKFIVLELCDDISIDTIVVANFEFFSSSFRTFRVSVSDKYPIKLDKWMTLGTFEARNTREVQAFLVENPVIWARYVRIEFLTHYGSEFYCPVSLIRVHGYTMMEDYKHDLATSTEDDDEDDDVEQVGLVDVLEDKSIPEAVGNLISVDQRQDPVVVHQDAQVRVISDTSEIGYSELLELTNSPSYSNPASLNTVSAASHVFGAAIRDMCLPAGESPVSMSAHSEQSAVESSSIAKSSPVASVHHIDSAKARTLSYSTVSSSESAPVPMETHSSAFGKDLRKEPHISISSNSSAENKKTTVTGTDHTKSSDSTSKEAGRSHASKQPVSVTQSQPPLPTMQESFFKSVQKRIQMLETNSSLSLQYIEEQSRALRDAFRKVEQRQLSKTGTFLEHLNQTVLSELREFRQQYDQLWQSTVIELQLQRERYQQESQAMHARLGVLADELIFQRRVSMLQMILILVCLGLVLFSRGGMNAYLELPLVQSVLSRSPNSKWISVSGDSRGNSPVVTRTRSTLSLEAKQGILKSHRRGVSEDSNNEPLSASEMYSPPTPVSFDGFSDVDLAKIDPKTSDPEFDPIQIERPSTSPPVLPSNEDPSTPRSIIQLDDTSIESRILTPTSRVERQIPPELKLEHPTPPGRHLTWNLPDDVSP